MNDATTLAALATEYHDFRQRSSPTTAHLEGDYRYADRFEDASRGAEDREIAEDRAFAARARALPELDLGPEDRITREMIAFDADARADVAAARLPEFGADPIFGPQVALTLMIPRLPLQTAWVAEAMIPKYRSIALWFRDLAGRLQEGVADNRTPAEFAVRMSVEQLDAWLAADVADDPLLALVPPTGLPDPDGWIAELRRIVAAEIRPAAAMYRDVLRHEVRPKARPDERCGLSWLAGGDEVYRRLIAFYTTLSISAEEVHRIGLGQVESLAREYRALGPTVVGSADLATIFERLRSDPLLHHTNGDDVVGASRAALLKAKAAMGDWFGRLPRAGCDVAATLSGAQAFYFPPASDGARDGVFFMNTAVPSDWGRYQIEATAYHEGIPGHHLQIAIGTELESVPEFRKRAFMVAHGEGWGLYAERLADEMGLYSTPLDRMGMLCADSMRACRLVVDTGMHAFGWSRRRAIDYMVANSPMREGHVAAEVDRYAVTPGQALAYMIGRLEIERIRAAAEETLGERFDIRAFHDAVIGSGLMPLPILARHVRDWAASA